MRRIPIPAALLPLLATMKEEAQASVRLRVLNVNATANHLSRQLRLYLRMAGVVRHDLHATDDAHRKAMTFHDLRATGITWAIVEGTDPLRVSHWAGHADFATTRIYCWMAEDLSGAMGTVFPPLPAAVFVRSNETGRKRGRPVAAKLSATWPKLDEQVAGITAELVEAPRIENRGIIGETAAIAHPGDQFRDSAADVDEPSPSPGSEPGAPEAPQLNQTPVSAALQAALSAAVAAGDLGVAQALLDIMKATTAK